VKVRGAIVEKNTGVFNKKDTGLRILLLGGKKGELAIEGATELLNDFDKNDEVTINLEKVK